MNNCFNFNDYRNDIVEVKCIINNSICEWVFIKVNLIIKI